MSSVLLVPNSCSSSCFSVSLLSLFCPLFNRWSFILISALSCSFKDSGTSKSHNDGKSWSEGILFSLSVHVFALPLRYFSLCRLFWLNRCASFSFWGSSTKPELQNNTLPSLIILWKLYLLASSSLASIFVTSRVRSWVNKCFCFNLPWIHCPLSVFVLISDIRCFPYLTMNRFKLALIITANTCFLALPGFSCFTLSAVCRNRMHKVELASQLSDFATCDWKRAIFEHPRLQNLIACVYRSYYNFSLDVILKLSTLLYSSDFTS